MARTTPPTIISYTETAAWNTAASSKSTASVSWNAGDQIGVVGVGEGAATLAVPTATGLTFTSRAVNSSNNSCCTRGAGATAATSGSGAISMGNSSATIRWGFAVWVLRGSDGFGSTGQQATTTHTVSVVPTDTHSAWIVACGDFSTAVVTGNSITPTVTTSRQKTQFTGAYSLYLGDIADQASAASTPYGLTAGGTTGAISIVAMEVLGTTVAAAGPQIAMAPYRGAF
jgi:hypothetical protein